MRFSEAHTYAVELHHRDLGKLGEATLTFGAQKSVVAEMQRRAPGARLSTGQTLDSVSAYTEDGRSFTLCQCTVHGFAIYANYLALGILTGTQICRLDIRFSDISEWFLSRQKIHGKVGERLTWSDPVQHLSVDVADGPLTLRVSSRYMGFRKTIGEDQILNEHVKFGIEVLKGAIELNTVQDKVLELGALLSLLVMYPISVISVEVSTTPDRVHSIYFGTFKALERDTTWSFTREAFIQKDALDGGWATILQKFYQDENRRNYWRRLAGMLRFEGFWEFNFLAYVSLLDKAVSQRAQTLAAVFEPPGRKRLNALYRELERISPRLGPQVITDIVGIVKGIFVHRRSTFSDKYRYCLRNTDADLVKIINITDADFRLIKQVRDNVAHGEDPGIVAAEFARAESIVRKISLLLTHWTFVDLGMAADKFLAALNSTGNKIRYRAALDDKSLARATKSAELFEVSPETLRVLSSRKEIAVFACFIEGPAGEIEFADAYFETWRRWNNDPQRSAEVKWSELFGVPAAAVRYAGTVYVESGSDTLQLSAVCLFDRSQLPSTPTRR